MIIQVKGTEQKFTVLFVCQLLYFSQVETSENLSNVQSGILKVNTPVNDFAAKRAK